MNRIRAGLGSDIVPSSWPPPRAGLVLVEGLRTFVPRELVPAGRRSVVRRVLADYPGYGAKTLNYVLQEGLGATLEKTRAKLDQKRVELDFAMSAVGTVVQAPAGSSLSPGDLVACGGFVLPVEADAYLFHPDQCTKVERDAPALETHFWLGALVELARQLAARGARTIAGIGLGALERPFAAWCAQTGLAASPSADAAIVGARVWAANGGTPPAPQGIVLDPTAAIASVPAPWELARMPPAGTFRSSPLDPRPLEWPFPFGPSGRSEALRLLLGIEGATPAPAAIGSRPRRVNADAHRSPGGLGLSAIGCGNFARAVVLFHARRVPGVRLRGICDIRPEVAAVNARALGAAFHTADPTEILGDPETEGVFVTSYHSSHAEYVAAALDAGKAVHVEKPPAVSPDQLEAILAALARTSGTLTIGYNRPFAPAYPLIIDALDAERGPVIVSMTVKAEKLPPEHWYYWPNEGTRLAGNLVHWIDLGYRLVAGARPVAVQTVRDRGRVPALAADAVVITTRFEDGSLSSITTTTAGDDLLGVHESIEIGRGKTSIRVENFDRLQILRGADRVKRRFGRNRGHAAEFVHVVDRLRRRESDPQALRDMVVTSAILFAAQRSFVTGFEEPVQIFEHWRLP